MLPPQSSFKAHARLLVAEMWSHLLCTAKQSAERRIIGPELGKNKGRVYPEERPKMILLQHKMDFSWTKT